MSRRRLPPVDPPPDVTPDTPVTLLGSPAPAGALVPPLTTTPAAEPSSPFGNGVASLRPGLPELDEGLESAGASGRSWGSQAAHQPAVATFGRPRFATAPKVNSLEELYGLVPELSEPGARLRVDRTGPEWVNTPEGKTATAGTLGYLTSTPSTEQFAQMFGGRTYSVFAMVDTSPKDNKGGPPMEVCKGIAELKIPLDPNLDNLPIVGAAGQQEYFDMPNAYGFFRPSGNQPIIIGQQQQPMPQQAAQPQPPPPEFYGLLGRVVDRSLDGNRQQQAPATDPAIFSQMADRPMQILEQQNRNLQEQLQRMQDKLEQQSERPSSEVAVLQSMSGVLTAMKGQTSEADNAALRIQHDREIERINRQFEADRARLVDDHARLIDALTRDHKNALERQDKDRQVDVERLRMELESERRRAAEREKDLRDQHDKETRRVTDDFEKRLRDKEESFDRRERDIRAQHDQYTGHMKESYESRLRELDRSHQSEMATARMHGDTLKTTVEATSSVEIRSLQSEVAKLTAQLASAQERAERLERDNRPKPFLEQLGEVTQTAQAVGFVKPGDMGAGAGGGEAEMGTRDRIVQTLVEGASQHIPEIIAATGIGPALGAIANKVAGVQPGQEPPRRVNVTQVISPPAQLPAPQQRLSFPDGNQGSVPPPAPQQQQRHPAPQHQAQAGGATQAQQPATQPATSVVAAPWAGFEWTTLPDATLASVFRTIFAGLKADTPATNVVADLAQQFGPEMVSTIPTLASVDRVIASIRKAPATAKSPLASPQGRAYVRDVWHCMAAPSSTPAAPPAVPTPAKEGTAA